MVVRVRISGAIRMNHDVIDAVIVRQMAHQLNRDLPVIEKKDLRPPDYEGGYICEHCELETGYEGDPLEEFRRTGETPLCPHCSWHLGVEVE